MNAKAMRIGICFTVFAVATGCAVSGISSKAEESWPIHSLTRPRPKVVTPGIDSTQEKVGTAPSDAIVLFDGKDLSQWVSVKDGGPAEWKVENGYMEVVKKTAYIQTKREFGDCQLHIEWAAPAQVGGTGQSRGNSGVFLMGKYEVQILDSYSNETYADGQAGALYGQKPPLVNACRPAGQWQSYDIIFHRPIFKNDKVVQPATITVFHNGVLIQDNYEIKGTTWHKRPPQYEPHGDRLPIVLQNHRDPVRFRNIWIREL